MFPFLTLFSLGAFATAFPVTSGVGTAVASVTVPNLTSASVNTILTTGFTGLNTILTTILFP